MVGMIEFIAVDIETTGLDCNIDEIIEIGAARYRNLKLVDTFSKIIDPGNPIPKEITDLTGIADEIVSKEGRDANEVLAEFVDYIGDSILVYHNAAFDISFLEKFIPDIGKSYLDAKIIGKILYPFQRAYGLTRLADMCNVVNDRHHRGLNDAKATGEILIKFIAARRFLPVHLLDKLKLFCSYWGNEAMKQFFTEFGNEALPNKIEDELIPPGSLPAISQLSGKRTDGKSAQDIGSIFAEEGELAFDLGNYEFRAGQAEMASDCCDAIEGGAFLLAEAGTGTGKSLSYIFPSMISAAKGTKIFIATRTKNLQKQLFEKDLPAALKYYPEDLKVSLLKGRANYLCLLKLYNLSLSAGLITPAEVPRMLNLLAFAEYSATGDFAEIRDESSRGYDFYSNRFSSSDGMCSGSKCSFYKKCFLFKARKRARESSIVIINHHLFFADLSAETDILNDFKTGVFDEAHQLDSVAREYLGMEFSSYSISSILDKLLSEDAQDSPILDAIYNQISRNLIMDMDIENLGLMVKGIKELSKGISRANRNYFEGISLNASKLEGARRPNRTGGGIKIRYRYGDSLQVFIDETAALLLQKMEKLATELEKLSELAKHKGEAENSLSEILEILSQDAGVIAALCERFRGLTLAEENGWVYWFETSRGRGHFSSLKAAPINTGPLIYDAVHSNLNSAIFTSATLRGNSDFENVKFRLGLDLVNSDRVIEKSYPSPFKYKDLLRVFILEFMPHPDSANFAMQASEIIDLFARALRKNMMVLTTSYAQLESLYELSSARLSSERYTVLAQGINGAAEEVAKKFAKSKPALLIGTDSFWEGVDFPGEQLEVLFVSRLPFAVPTEPIVQAIGEYFQSMGLDPFKSNNLPEAIIKFRQGCGRLIRSRTDRGVIVLMDNRILMKYYGRAFINSLPVAPIVINSQEQLESILFGLSNGKS